MSADSDFAKLFRRLRDQGWKIDTTSRGHYRCAPLDRSQPIVHVSASDDPRAMKNAIKDLKRSGYLDEDVETVEATSEGEARITMPTNGSTQPYRSPQADPDPPPPSPPFPLPPPPSPPPSIDALFTALKAAREDLELAEMARAEMEAEKARVEACLEAANAECMEKMKRFRVARLEFDAAITPQVSGSTLLSGLK